MFQNIRLTTMSFAICEYWIHSIEISYNDIGLKMKWKTI